MIVLIHGTGASLHTWDGWARLLETDFQVLRYDMPGFGLTGPAPDGDYRPEAQCEWLRKLFQALNLGPAIVAGNSYGGWVAFTCAALHPEGFTKLILIDSTGLPGSGHSMPAFKALKLPIVGEILENFTPRFFTERTLKMTYGHPELVTEAQIDRYYELNLRSGNRQALRERLRIEPKANDWERLKTVKQETLILWGDQDSTYHPEVASAFEQALPHARKVIFSGLGHIPMEESPEVSVVPVRKFLLSDTAFKER